jgi:hypothetical protein
MRSSRREYINLILRTNALRIRYHAYCRCICFGSLINALCVVRDRNIGCRMALEANAKDHFPALSIVEKCCVLSCHG